MPGPQRAQEELEKFKIEKWAQRREERVRKLPWRAKRVADYFLRDDKTRNYYWEAPRDAKERQRALQDLENLNPRDRIALFEAFLPSLGRPMECMWQKAKGMPYQGGLTRRAFRTPHHPEATLPRRFEMFSSIKWHMREYEQNAAWVAAWVPYLGNCHESPAFGLLLAAVIDAGGQEGDEIYRILSESAKGEHEIGRMSRLVPRALLSASRPEGWELIENMLIAAQREEGLRQAILETIDEAHPQAFRRMLRLILAQNLARFAAVARAVDVWFGFDFDVEETKAINGVIERALRFLDDPAARAEARKTGDPEETYLALWADGCEDAVKVIATASSLLRDAIPERRFAAVYLLSQLGLIGSNMALLPALEDGDLRVSAHALRNFCLASDEEEMLNYRNLFETLESIFPQYPEKEKELTGVLWPWCKVLASRNLVCTVLLKSLGKRSPDRLLPYMTAMDVTNRRAMADKLAQVKKIDGRLRETFFALVGDTGSEVRERAIKKVGELRPTVREARQLEEYLTRKAGNLRRGVITILLNQPDAEAIGSAHRLLEGAGLQRTAGLEILRKMVGIGRSTEKCRKRIEEFVAAHPEISGEERTLVEVMDAEKEEPLTLDNALGLMSPANRTTPLQPSKRMASYGMKAALALIASLDGLVHGHREKPVTIEYADGTPDTEILGTLQWLPECRPKVPREEDIHRLPLREVWEEWWLNRPADLRDRDGLELVRAMLAMEHHRYARHEPERWATEIEAVVLPGVRQKETKYGRVVTPLLGWLFSIHPSAGAIDFLLDGLETALALIPEKEMKVFARQDQHDILSSIMDRGEDDGRSHARAFDTFRSIIESCRPFVPTGMGKDQHERYWRLLRWYDEPVYGPRRASVPRSRAELDVVLDAYNAGCANNEDIYDLLLGTRAKSYRLYGREDFRYLQRLTRRKPSPYFESTPDLREIVDHCRRRILEVESGRGDMETPASAAAAAISFSGGMEVLFTFLVNLGKGNLVRGWTQDSASKESSFSHVIRASFPSEQDTPGEFKLRARERKLSERRLVEVAVFAPQWSRHVEHALEWPGFSSAVWWIHGHTKDTSWEVDTEIREAWSAEVNTFTPLTGQDLLDGAVDVKWFNDVYAQIGPERWKQLDNAAKFASAGGGHTRARLFADAMRGTLLQDEVLRIIDDRRHQDTVRALGLLPLPESAARTQMLLERYEALQKFLQGSRKFGSQRQQSEKQCVRIAMDNLARTAGYPDPIRLEWAMEAHAVADLAGGTLHVAVGDIDLSLSIDETGAPVLKHTRDGKELKSLPAAIKKNPEVTALRERLTSLKRQAARMKGSLEEAMIRGDEFTGAELRELMKHPLLSPVIKSLVFVGDDIIGYPTGEGGTLRDYAGRELPVPAQTRIRVAHGTDLLKTAQWGMWQRECFAAGRRQPFKQVFRELYTLTAAETDDGMVSRRYDGHQVQPMKAAALLGRRGWVNHPEEGVRRTFHDANLTVYLSGMLATFTPAEVEGTTIEGVSFTRRNEWKSVKLEEVPPRIFSEVMRDLDLAVSVAHRGGVDPEASMSTMEMRAALLRETLALLEIRNVRIEEPRAFVEGELGNYTIHLGSAIVHRMPGGHLCIIPVHAQHRGRIFLPFADDDPKTAEVISKVITLAKDKELKDPTILAQIYAKP